MPPNESITYMPYNFKINLFMSFTIISNWNKSSTEAKYIEWIQAMVTTPVGTEKDITVYGESIHVDGVKGKDDVETMVNLGAWVASHKIHVGDPENYNESYGYDSGYYIYEDDFLGAECGGLNAILVDGALLLGHTAWEYVDSSGGHMPMSVIIDGWLWTMDAGGSGKSLPRGFSAGGVNPEQTVCRSYYFTVNGGSVPTDVLDTTKWYEWDAYYDIDANGNITKRD